MARMAFILLCVFLLGGTAMVREIDVDGVPLPDDAVVRPSTSPMPTDHGEFTGAWVGAWGGLLRHILVVEDIRANGVASVIYAIGGNPAWGIKRAWHRSTAKIEAGKLTISSSYMQATYQIWKPGVMGGFYEAGPWHDTARMTRAPLPQLLSPSAKVSWSRRIEDRLATDLVENGKPVGLEVILFKPEGPGPFPLAVLNHGSTGDGKDPRIFSLSWAADGIAAFLVDRGWLVAFPQRRGRGKSDGLYDEGFEVDRTQGYTSGITRTTQGFERALTDIAAAIKALQKRPDVAAGPILIGGQSRGGILSVAYAGRHPETVAAVLNFVGGWLGGEDQDAGPINQGLFKRGAVYPGQTLWLYGLDDAVYSIAHCRRNFTAFEATGGKGQFIEFDVPGKDRGHGVIDFDELWRGAVERYLDTLPVKP